ncbi:MAG: LysR family transcriptional regulator [Ruminococcaceae bacterium]|nr:LysR family transcriptional regulator [Oscillospiraceae bacterium]
METLKIKAVLAAARCGSLSRAAEEFSYTPSAFSHMLAGFEEDLGVRLFKRSSAGVTLTREGETLLPKFEKMIACEKEISDTVSGLIAEESRHLRIATYSSISRNLLSRFLGDFKKSYPDIKLSIHVADNLEGWTENGHTDVVFADNIVLSGGEWFPITTDRYYAVAPEGLLGERESVTREELYELPHIFTDDEYLQTVFEKERFRELIYFRSEDDQAVIQMVRAGMGVAVMPELVLRGNMSGVSIIELEPEVTRTLGFAYRRGTRSLAVSKFVKYLKSALAHEK